MQQDSFDVENQGVVVGAAMRWAAWNNSVTMLAAASEVPFTREIKLFDSGGVETGPS